MDDAGAGVGEYEVGSVHEIDKGEVVEGLYEKK